jgi:hypothetical protein
MKKFNWNYDSLQGMDIFFSTSDISLIAYVTRIANVDFKNTFNNEISTHSGVITEDQGVFFATEETLFGLKENSLKNYNGSNKQIISIYRWNKFNDFFKEKEGLKQLAELREKKLKYDYFTFFTYPKCLRWIRKLVNRKKDDDSSQICSETVFRRLKAFGLENYPSEWDEMPPSPYALECFIKIRNDFVKIENYKKD